LGTLKSSIQNAANNATSDLNSYLTQTAPSGNIVCSTCHSPHYADSRSSTFDGASSAKGRGSFANLSTGDGNILRTDRRGKKVTSSETYAGNDKLNICTNCHANKKSHNAGDQDVQCNDCHGAHVQFDATSSVQSSLNPNHLKNVYLIRRNASKAGVSTKIFFRYTGTQREYKNANGTGVCQGCHDVPAPGGTSPSGSTYPPEHDNTLAKDCNACHSHGSQAGSFSGACGKCHGNPPIDAAGMAQPATGVLPAGQWGSHEIHAKTRKMSCNTCHDGYVDRATMPSNTIDMGFAINGGNFPAFKANTVNGQYNTSASLISKFSGTGAAVGTDSTCSNVYCHGATLTPGAVSQPYWISTDNESNYGIPAGTCSACHETAGNYLTMGSHVVHAGSALGFACANCHGAHDNNDHVNGSVSWSFDAGTMGASAKYKTPSGAYATSGETGRLAPSSANAGYGTCDNIVCHGASSAHNLPWGGTLWAAKGVAGETCAKCHSSFKSYSTTKAFYSTSYPTQVTASSDLKVGAHAVHLKGKHTSDNACAVCHGTVTTLNHMTGTTSFSWSALASSNGAVPTYSSSAGTCSNYCHGAKMPNGDTSGSLRTPTWTASFLGTVAACGKCHGAPPTSHGGINTPTSFAEVATYCSGCHPEVINSVPGSTYDTVFKDKSLHVNGKVEGGGCNGCHGYPPSRKGFTGTTGSYEFARAENYSSGGGAHTVQGHVPAAANASEGWVNCSKCHKQDTNHPSRTGGFLPSSNIKVEIDQKYRFSNSKNTPQAKYSSSRLDGAAHVAGRCNNISCHFQKTPKW
jgi:predicted CxxxxCH...CXXCH cytochrome family protein